MESLVWAKKTIRKSKRKKKVKKGNKTMWYVSEYIMKDQNLSAKPCTVVLKIIYITRKIIKLLKYWLPEITISIRGAWHPIRTIKILFIIL